MTSTEPELAVRIEGLGKRYRIGERLPYKSLRESLSRGAARVLRRAPQATERKEFWAIRNVDLEVKRGQVVGIVGHNGAGKSTLLKILSRITEPTEGRAVIHGRVGALLEVGTGFHPELTGRENVFLNGAILGMRRREIEAKFDEIVAFSEIEPFIDTPIKHYSSGMRVRLAFSVAAHLEPEVMIIDEVLAVGDAAFQRKCLGKMNEVAGAGRTVLFVSHNLSAVNNLCHEGALLDHGRVIFRGSTAETVARYMSSVLDSSGSLANPIVRAADPSLPAQLDRVALEDAVGNLATRIPYEDAFRLAIALTVRDPSPDYYVQAVLTDPLGNWILFTADEDEGRSPLAGAGPGTFRYRVTLPARLLKPGAYQLAVAVNRRPEGRVDQVVLGFEVDDYVSPRGMRGRYRRYAIVAPEVPWTLEGA